jgi:hypothetical protein
MGPRAVLDRYGKSRPHRDSIPGGICSTYCFPRQQCLHERASIVRYTRIVCLVYAKRRCQINLPYHVFYLIHIFKLTVRWSFCHTPYFNLNAFEVLLLFIKRNNS